MTINLRYMLGMALLTVVHSASAADRLATIPHWANDEAKTVYFVPRGILNAELDHLGMGDQYDYHFTLELTYDPESMKSQFGEVQASYPGYQVQRPILEKSQDTYRLAIPSIGVSADVEIRNGPTGPWFTWETYLTKNQGEALRAQMTAGSDAISVKGSLSADVPLPTIVEKRELNQVTCESILGDDATVESFMRGVSDLKKYLDQTRFQYASTRESLVKSVFNDCFQLQSEVSVASFKELLEVKLQPKHRGFHPVGETKKTAPVAQSAPLFYELNFKTN